LARNTEKWQKKNSLQFNRPVITLADNTKGSTQIISTAVPSTEKEEMECKNEIQKYIKSVYYMKQQQMEQETIMSRVVRHCGGVEDPAQQFEASEPTPAIQNGSGAWPSQSVFKKNY